MQALQEDVLDIELRGHIDARALRFSEVPAQDDALLDCEQHYGSVEGGCGYLMYLHRTRSLRVRLVQQNA